MANARIQRAAADGGRLPKVCICCGDPADRFVRHRFRWQPSWWLVSMPIVGLLIVGIVALLAWMEVPRVVGRALVLVVFVYLIPFSTAVELAVPVCSGHRYRLKWHEFFLWLLLIVLVGVAAAIVNAAANEDMETSESLLLGCLTGAPVLLLVSIAIRFFTPRLVASEYGHIDMAMLSSDFVRALATPQSSPQMLVSQPAGRALPSGLAAVPRWVLLGGGGGAALLALSILSCAGGFQFLKWYQHQQFEDFVARNAEKRERLQSPAPLPPIRGLPPDSPARNLAPPPPPPPAASAAAASWPAAIADESNPPAAPADESTPPASPRRAPPELGGIGQGGRPTRAAPGFELTSLQEVQVNDLVHVWTGENWRTGVALEVASDRVRVRLVAGPPTPGEWYAFDEVRHMRSPDMRAALARSRPKTPAVATTPSTTPPSTTAPADPAPASSPAPKQPVASPGPPSRAPQTPSTGEATQTPTAGEATPAKAPAANRGNLQTWTDASGKFKIEAELVKVEDEQAVLRKADGSIVRIPLSKLSLEDRLQAVAQSP